MIYTSATLSLAALELLVHLDPEDAPGELVSIEALIPASVAIDRLSADGLPSGWRRSPPPDELAALGAEWLRLDRTAVLAVPSAVVPPETNYLLNPAHRDFRRIRVAKPQPFAFDPRLRRN